MTTDELRDTLINSSFTMADVQRRTRFLQGFLESQFFATNGTDLKSFLQAHDATQTDVEVMLGWGATFYQAFTRSNLYELIKAITESIRSLPSMVLYLPYTPDDAGRAFVGATLRKIVGSPVILDIRYDPSLGAGCSFSTGGMYKDYSLRTMLANKRDVIHQIVTKYANSAK